MTGALSHRKGKDEPPYRAEMEIENMKAPKVKLTENGQKLKPHDGVSEVSVCGKCGTLIDWASDAPSMTGRDRDDTSCPACGHPDTAWLYAD